MTKWCRCGGLSLHATSNNATLHCFCSDHCSCQHADDKQLPSDHNFLKRSRVTRWRCWRPSLSPLPHPEETAPSGVVPRSWPQTRHTCVESWNISVQVAWALMESRLVGQSRSYSEPSCPVSRQEHCFPEPPAMSAPWRAPPAETEHTKCMRNCVFILSVYSLVTGYSVLLLKENLCQFNQHTKNKQKLNKMLEDHTGALLPGNSTSSRNNVYVKKSFFNKLTINIKVFWGLCVLKVKLEFQLTQHMPYAYIQTAFFSFNHV